MGVQFGTWPPQGKQTGLTAGTRNAFGRPKLLAQIDSAGVVVSDLFGVIDNVDHSATGVFIITLVDTVVVQATDVPLVTTEVDDINAAMGWAALDVPNNAIRVETRDSAAGTSLDAPFFICLEG